MMTDRRSFLTTAATGALATAAAPASTVVTATASLAPSVKPSPAESEPFTVQLGRIHQSACHWNFNRGEPLSVERLAQACVQMGLKSVELVGPEHWDMLKRYGLTCAIAGSHGFAKGFAHTEEHDQCIESLKKSIDACVAHGVKRVITFSGFRRGLDDATAMKNMIDGLKKILPYAEEHNVALCLEMLNSRVAEEMKGHPDYWCDHMDLAREICEKIGSPQMKILFDIYHVQIMDGDVIRRLEQCAPFIGHIHTAGNPGRGDLDDEQEIHYPGLMHAIVKSGYTGFVGQEFIPRATDVTGKLAALNRAVRLCDV
jgi:hydroxypyruvate isomerase